MSATINLSGVSAASGSCPAQTITTGSTYDLIATMGTSGIGKLTITGIVAGTGPLTGLKLTFAAVAGGTHVPALTDADFSTATDTALRTLGLSTPTNIVTGSLFQFTVDLFGAVAEVALRAKSTAGATVAVEAFGSGAK